jgi:hypothetical protein
MRKRSNPFIMKNINFDALQIFVHLGLVEAEEVRDGET